MALKTRFLPGDKLWGLGPFIVAHHPLGLPISRIGGGKSGGSSRIGTTEMMAIASPPYSDELYHCLSRI